MRPKKKQRRIGILAIATVILLVVFAGFLLLSRQVSPSYFRADVSASCDSAPTNSPDLYGQAYSPNIGWINFYCDNGDTNPDIDGVQALVDFCDVGNSYKVSLNSATNTFSGYAYSSNYGWLDMNGINLETGNLLDGSTDYGNFGSTDFAVTGVSLDSCTYDFSGFAYSENIGWISFATPSDPTLQALYGSYDYSVKIAGLITKDVYGQAYSANIGWVNFYCDGSGGARPADASGGPGTMPLFCDDVAYGTVYDPRTGTFSGVAYSNNLGWLDMNDLILNASDKIEGSTDGASMGATYNFGTTYFAENEPNSENPGVRYYSDQGYFCGFAYSDTAGYLSFCDPQTKEKEPLDVSVEGYDWNTYAVYMGMPDTTPPVPTTAEQYFAADATYNETIWFQDDSDIASLSIRVAYEDDYGNTQTVEYDSPVFDNANNRASIDIVDHDFHVAPRRYSLVYSACDVNSNCVTDEEISNFFNVNTAAPATLAFDPSSVVIADGSEELAMKMKVEDEFGNTIAPETGVKEVKVKFNYDNEVFLDQIGLSGSAIYFSGDTDPIAIGVGVTPDWFSEVDGDDNFILRLKSYAPTGYGFEPMSGDGFEFQITDIDYEITWLGDFAFMGTVSDTVSLDDPATLDEVETEKAGFSPVFTATPEALNFNGSDYVETDEAKNNIAINSLKRMNIELKNVGSSKTISDVEIGFAAYAEEEDGSINANVDWNNARIEKIGDSASSTDLVSNLDTDRNGFFDESLMAVDSTAYTPGTIKNILIQIAPRLDQGQRIPARLKPMVETYLSYTIDGKTVKHKGGNIIQAARIYNPSIAVKGSIYTEGGSFSKQESGLGQSFGDLSRNELKTGIDRSVSAFIEDTDVSACESDNMSIIGEDGVGNFITDNITSCSYNDDSILYFSGKDVVLDLATEQLPSGKHTIVIQGGNLYIKSNLAYQKARDSFGVIIVKNNKDSDTEGNVYVYPNVSSIVGAYYTEGGFISVNSQGKIEEDSSNACDGSLGFCDRTYELRHQLYFKGTLATANTVGGSDNNPIAFPSALSPALVSSYETAADGGRAKARIYDLAYLRTFHKNEDGSYSGAPASGISSDDAVVFRYDGRIATNPPPLFANSGLSTGGDVGF